MCGLLSTSATFLKFLKDCTSQYNFRFIFLSSNGNIINEMLMMLVMMMMMLVMRMMIMVISLMMMIILSVNDYYVVYLSSCIIEGEEIVENIITCRNFPDTLRLLFLLMIKIAIRATTATATIITTTINKNNNNKVAR